MTRFALHPRLAHMVLQGRAVGAAGLACELAALLSERDLLGRPGDPPDADIALRLDILRGATLRCRCRPRRAPPRARGGPRLPTADCRPSGIGTGSRQPGCTPGLCLPRSHSPASAGRRRTVPPSRRHRRRARAAGAGAAALSGRRRAGWPSAGKPRPPCRQPDAGRARGPLRPGHRVGGRDRLGRRHPSGRRSPPAAPGRDHPGGTKPLRP